VRVLHVIAGLSASDGGPARAVQECATASAERGHEVRVLVTDAGLDVGTLQRLRDDADVAYDVFSHVGRGPLRVSSGLHQSVRSRVGEVDVVHVHSLYMPHTLVTLRAALRAGVPCVVRPHGTLGRYQRRHGRSRKLLWDLATGQTRMLRAEGVVIHAVSPVEAAEILEVLPDGHVEVAELGVAAVEVRQAADRPTALFLGRIADKKRLDVLFSAMGEIVASQRDTGSTPVLVLAGERPTDAGRVDRMLDEAGIRPLVERVGVVEHEHKAALLASAWCTVLLSEDENFGVAVAESLLAGVPVVVSDRVAVSEFVKAHPVAGRVVPVADVPAAAHAIGRLLTRPLGLDKRRELQALAVEQFGLEGLGVRLDRLYQAAGAVVP